MGGSKKFFTYTASTLLLLLGLATSRPIKFNLLVAAKAPATERNAVFTRQNEQPRLSLPDKSSAPMVAQTDPNLPGEEIELAVENIADADLLALLESLGAQTGPTAMETRQLLLRRWADRDAAAAAAWAIQFPEGPVRSSALEQVAIAWANSDLKNTAAWLRDLPDGESKQVATLATAYEATRSAPLTALDLASNLAPTSERNELLAHAASQWATDNFAAAAEWAGKISDADLRQQMLAAIAVAGAGENAPAAAAFIANSLTPGETQARAAVSITQRWTQSAPPDAAAWISQFPDLPVRDAAVENLVGLWAQHDSAATANWLSALPSGSLRTTAINAFAANQSQFDSTP